MAESSKLNPTNSHSIKMIPYIVITTKEFKTAEGVLIPATTECVVTEHLFEKDENLDSIDQLHSRVEFILEFTINGTFYTAQVDSSFVVLRRDQGK